MQIRSLSARRYRVEGDLPPVDSPSFAKRLTERRFRALAPGEERAFGWVSADNLLDATFHPGTLSRGPCAAFALRIDRRRADSRLVRATLDLEQRAVRAAEGSSRSDGSGGPEGPGRRRKREERMEMRRAVAARLLEEARPTIEVHPVLLFPRTRTLLFLGLSRPANDTFRAHFSDTFDTTLSALTPFHRGLELLQDRGGSGALASLRRAEFARQGPRAAVAEALS